MTTDRGRPGIEGIEALRYHVNDLDRSHAFYTQRLGFRAIAKSTHALEAREGERSLLFASGGCRVLCTAPLRPDSRASRFLAQHPDGIGEVVFRVRDATHALSVLEARGATPIGDVETIRVGEGALHTFAIATPFESCRFRFTERRDVSAPLPLGETLDDVEGETSPFLAFDHLTANLETLAPAALWLEQVLGWDDFWKVELGTSEEAQTPDGTGLRSRVLVDPESKLKIALNEPKRPNFEASQIEVFVEQNRGPGIQHAALAVDDLPHTVALLRTRGVEFLETPGTYYDLLPARLAKRGITIEEPVEELRRLGILVDGASASRYLLQIFLRDSASVHHDADAGPFFFELIERRGDPGFGEGNFRALFEAIERDQRGGG